MRTHHRDQTTFLPLRASLSSTDSNYPASSSPLSLSLRACSNALRNPDSRTSSCVVRGGGRSFIFPVASRRNLQCPPATLVPRYSLPRRVVGFIARTSHVRGPFGQWLQPFLFSSRTSSRSSHMLRYGDEASQFASPSRSAVSC